MTEPINTDEQLALDGYKIASAMSTRLLDLRVYLQCYFDHFEGLSDGAHEQLRLLLGQIDLTLMALHEDQGRAISG